MNALRKSLTEGTLPLIPDYDPDLFVNREPEIKLVLEIVRALSLGKPVKSRTIVFWGYKGSGRTWLLRHIAGILKAVPDAKPLYLDLGIWADRPAEEATVALFVHLVERIWGSDSEQASLYRRATDAWPAMIASWLQDEIGSLLQKQVLVLLLDHVYESAPDFLEILEERLLAPVAIQPRALIVMAGRGQAYPWKMPEIRLYTLDLHLSRFDEDLTRKQLQLQKEEAVPRATEIYQMSQGYPLGNYLLADRLPDTALQETVDGLLEGIPTEERSWIEALCILRTFHEEHIPPLLTAYFEDESILKWRYKEIRRVRDRLLHTRIVRWYEEASGWGVDSIIRPILERYLQEIKPNVWCRLHCAAHLLYRDWEIQYPDEKYRWRAEADYHAECLRAASYELEDCP